MRTIPLRSSFMQALVAVSIIAIGCGDSGTGPTGGSTPAGGNGGEGPTSGGGGNPPIGGMGDGGSPTPVISCSDVENSDSCSAPDPIACECAGCELDVCADEGGGFNDCVCPTCNADPFCTNPASCMDDGACDPFNEGCLCADCADHPSCATGWLEICDNDADDNGNGTVDCEDVQCASAPNCQEICDNDTDDNGNGDVDCDDAGCADFPACVAPACTTPLVAVLGPNTGDTTGGTTLLNSSCANPGVAERVYTFIPATTGELTITLASPDDDLGFSVRTACDDIETEVVCADAELAGTDETATVDVTAATPITIIVQGFATTDEGPYTLTLALP